MLAFHFKIPRQQKWTRFQGRAGPPPHSTPTLSLSANRKCGGQTEADSADYNNHTNLITRIHEQRHTQTHTHTWPQDMKAYVQLPLAAADKQSRVEVNRTMTDKVKEEKRILGARRNGYGYEGNAILGLRL